MDTPLLVIGSFPVTTGLAVAAGFVVALLIVLWALVNAMRASAQRVELLARQAAEQLKASFLAQIAERDSRINELDQQVANERERGAELLDFERDKSAHLMAKVSALEAQMAEQLKQSEASLARFAQARQQMTDEFKAIAGDVLKSHSETFSRQNREQVDTLLKPLQDKIGEFHTGLIRDRAAMGEQIRALLESNTQITTEASNLTRALKGSSQTQGAWGEMILATILEQSGLREGEQYLVQQSHTGEDGQRLRTDVEIIMPNNDRLIIDSKVSLTAFEAFVNAEEMVRDQHLRAHLSSVRSHISTLGEKTYHRAARSSVDYVMMFVPIESALATAIQNDSKLIEYGMSKGVMLTTPTTLLTVLRTVRNVWDIEKRHQNAEEIAERAGALFDKVMGFLATMDRIGTHIDKAQQSYHDARGQLATGKGSVVRQVEMLRELGAKSAKQLPAGWDDGGEEPRLLRLVGEEPGDLA